MESEASLNGEKKSNLLIICAVFVKVVYHSSLPEVEIPQLICCLGIYTFLIVLILFE